jgi:four helix bundle protein
VHLTFDVNYDFEEDAMDERERFQDKFLEFGAEVVLLVKALPRSTPGRQIADQLLRSGTSGGANVHEAQSAESSADFVHKLQIGFKEIRETAYWLAIVEKSDLLKSEALMRLIRRCQELTAILARSVITAKSKLTSVQKNQNSTQSSERYTNP